jgi:hypothetical protein
MVTALLGHFDLIGAAIICLFAYGFFPIFFLRIIVLAYHREDPRREELLAEVYIVPRRERPVWVVEQLEVAICEGLRKRFVWAITGRIIYRWHLESGVMMNRKYPESFWIPDEEEKQAIVPGVHVRLSHTRTTGSARWRVPAYNLATVFEP